MRKIYSNYKQIAGRTFQSDPADSFALGAKGVHFFLHSFGKENTYTGSTVIRIPLLPLFGPDLIFIGVLTINCLRLV